MAKKYEGGVRHGQPVIDPVQQRDDTFYTNGPSDPRQYAGKNGVDSGPVPLSHWTGASDFYSINEEIGRSHEQKGLRPERQTKEEQRQVTPTTDAVIDGRKSK